MENNEKKVPLIWATALLVAGISVIITTVIPAFGFWEGAGIFLIGT